MYIKPQILFVHVISYRIIEKHAKVPNRWGISISFITEKALGYVTTTRF